MFQQRILKISSFSYFSRKQTFYLYKIIYNCFINITTICERFSYNYNIRNQHFYPFHELSKLYIDPRDWYERRVTHGPLVRRMGLNFKTALQREVGSCASFEIKLYAVLFLRKKLHIPRDLTLIHILRCCHSRKPTFKFYFSLSLFFFSLSNF